ncbi:MAG TPA: hypothetical protein VK203_31435 [Nostocaceae cyanobacterium]|nr:hypothetical protein [Nostocaceae cyanobacterium]
MTNSQSPQTKKSGNVWKWVGIGCGGALVIGIGLLAALVYTVQKTLNLSLDPQKAEEIAKSIVDYEIPGGSRGLVALDIQGMKIAGVASASDAQAVMLMVLQAPNQGNLSSEELQESIEQSRKNQNTGQFESKSKRQEKKQLCGQNTSITISEGELTNTLTRIPAITYEANINHEGKVLYIYLQTSGEKAQDDANQVFNSLKCK